MTINEITVLLIDDEKTTLQRSKQIVEQLIENEHLFCANGALEALQMLKERAFDLVLVDIEMPDVDGFSLADHIHDQWPDVKVVFLTGHVEFGAKSYDYAAFDFLTKPLNLARLRRTFEKFLESRKRTAPKSSRIAVSTAEGVILIDPEDVIYINKTLRKTELHCSTKHYVMRQSLDELEAIFSDYGIMRLHQSYLVNLYKIEQIMQGEIGRTYMLKMNNGETIPISRNQYAKLPEYLEKKGIRFI